MATRTRKSPVPAPKPPAASKAPARKQTKATPAKAAPAYVPTSSDCTDPEAHEAYMALNGECPWCGAMTQAVREAQIKPTRGRRAAQPSSPPSLSIVPPAAKAKAATKSPAKAAPKEPAGALKFVEGVGTTFTPEARPSALTALPAGYTVRWPHAGYDLARKDDKATPGPDWYVICNAHGTVTGAASAKTGDALGSKAGRKTWCARCLADD